MNTNIQLMMTLPDMDEDTLQSQIHGIFREIHERVRREDYINGKWSTVFYNGEDVGRFKITSEAETQADIDRANAANLARMR